MAFEESAGLVFLNLEAVFFQYYGAAGVDGSAERALGRVRDIFLHVCLHVFPVDLIGRGAGSGDADRPNDGQHQPGDSVEHAKEESLPPRGSRAGKQGRQAAGGQIESQAVGKCNRGHDTVSFPVVG